MTTRMLIGAAVCGFTALASAQSASVTISANDTVAPGGTLAVTVEASYDTAGAGGGLFGAAGFYGFGGTVTASGDAAGSATSDVPVLNGDLAFGQTTSGGFTGGMLARAAAGRGFDGGLAGGTASMMTFNIDIAETAVVDTTFDLTFDGAVVLVLDSNLSTFSTAPGMNQGTLTTNTLTVTIGEAGCNAADVAEDFGILDLSDIGAFVNGFTGQDDISDLNDDGVWDLADIGLFVNAFNAGCP